MSHPPSKPPPKIPSRLRPEVYIAHNKHCAQDEENSDASYDDHYNQLSAALKRHLSPFVIWDSDSEESTIILPLRIPKPKRPQERITIRLEYRSEGLGKSVKSARNKTWEFRIQRDHKLAEVFHTVQEELNEGDEDDDSLWFYYNGEFINAQDTPGKLGMTAAEIHWVDCRHGVVVKIVHSTMASGYLQCLPRKSFAQIKACYMQKIAASWNPSKGERLYLKYEGKLVLDESKVSCFRKRRLTLTAHISNDRRQKIEQEWNRIAREAGAAEIEFVNEIDDDEVPPTVGRLFKYLEAEYLFEMGVEPQISRLVRCRCKGGLCASGCHSPSNAHMYNSLVRVDIKHFAPKGLVYPGVSELLECNPRCTCDPDYCSNRRVQRPRQIKIQIFKTEKRGWGVRAKVDTVKGSILGIYTGLIIRRQDVQNLLISTYSFDLDAMESPEEPPENSYTVDAFGCGNWTRFINHSCQPNLKIIPAVYDSMPEDNLPYLAFVSTKDIAAYTELSFDYCPRRQEEWEQQKYKTKGTVKRKRAKTETRCFCGSTNCRGFL